MQIRLHSSPLHAKQVDDKVLTQPEYFRIPRARAYTHTMIKLFAALNILYVLTVIHHP